jgi:hypothetical protein
MYIHEVNLTSVSKHIERASRDCKGIGARQLEVKPTARQFQLDTLGE